MNYTLRCKNCAATANAIGEEEEDTNSCEIKSIAEWEEYDPADPLPHALDCCCKHTDCPGIFTKFEGCQHEEYDIINSSYPEPHEGDIM